MLTGTAFILVGYFVEMPEPLSIFLYVLGGLKILLGLLSIKINVNIDDD